MNLSRRLAARTRKEISNQEILGQGANEASAQLKESQEGGSLALTVLWGLAGAGPTLPDSLVKLITSRLCRARMVNRADSLTCEHNKRSALLIPGWKFHCLVHFYDLTGPPLIGTIKC